jgi:hypothetical protein
MNLPQKPGLEMLMRLPFGRSALPHQKRLLFVLLMATLSALFGAACSSDATDDGKPSDGTPAQRALDTDYAVKAYVTRGDGRPVLTKFGPADVKAATSRTTKGLLQPRVTGALEQDGSVGEMEDMTDQELADGKQPGWTLLQAALGTCLAEGAKSVWTQSVAATDSPYWGAPESYYAFGWFMVASPFPIRVCENRLQIEDLFLCAAGKLGEAATTLSAVEWTFHYNENTKLATHPASGAPQVTYIIPPQSTKDQFILRDLAIATLAQLARLDLEPAQPISDTSGEWTPGWYSYWSGQTCEARWSDALNDPSLLEPTDHVCFDSYSGDIQEGEELSLDDKIYCVQQSMRGHTHVLRAASRVLRRLLDDSFYADLSGAERNRAAAGDPSRGVQLMWGVDDSVDGSYKGPPIQGVVHSTVRQPRH